VRSALRFRSPLNSAKGHKVSSVQRLLHRSNALKKVARLLEEIAACKQPSQAPGLLCDSYLDKASVKRLFSAVSPSAATAFASTSWRAYTGNPLALCFRLLCSTLSIQWLPPLALKHRLHPGKQGSACVCTEIHVAFESRYLSRVCSKRK